MMLSKLCERYLRVCVMFVRVCIMRAGMGGLGMGILCAVLQVKVS